MALEPDLAWYTALIDDSGSGTDGSIVDKDDFTKLKDAALGVGASSELTISIGAVTITGNVHSLDTEGDAAADDLDTLTAGSNVQNGRVVILKPENAARVVTVKDGTGNLVLTGGDFVMNDAEHRLVLYRDGSSWYELCRNTALTTGVRQIVTAAVTGDFSTSSTSLVDVTNATISITTGASAKVVVMVTVPCRIASNSAWFDWKVDGVDNGNVQGVVTGASDSTITLFKVVTGLSAGAHTFQLRVRSSAGGAINISMASVMVGQMVAMEYR